MLGYMNQEALTQTLETNKVTFYSRSKKRLWTKGEESGNFLNLITISNDCDDDTLLVKVDPIGPTCHKGNDTCWAEKNDLDTVQFLDTLENTISDRINNDSEKSYRKMYINWGTSRVEYP